MCAVLWRFQPDTAWPLLLAAVRDEYLLRPWDLPAAHWPDSPGLIGGRDRTAGGTWLAVRPAGPAVAALLNGTPLQSDPSGRTARPSRGGLPLAALADELPTAEQLRTYDTF